MKHFICYLIFLFTISSLSAQTYSRPQRKKVAVVLSGGGAKGVAHIGALKVIEKAGIPIDYVVGTSMGSIIGGLYSIGYTPEQMDRLVRKQDWQFILSDAVNRNEELLIKKQYSEQYTISVPFEKKPKDALKGGVIAGRNIARLFSELTMGYHDSINFNKLPIPFACVAQNLVDGKEYVFHSGKLALAMRSSMSIPGVFEPVKWNGMVLVDGGMINNYPVDVAKKMGADIIIGVDVQEGLASSDKLNTLSDIAGQIINLLGIQKYNENVQNSDVHIHVNVEGYSSASFNEQAIKVLLERGETAAQKNMEALMGLKRQIGIAPNFIPKQHGPYIAPFTSTQEVKVIKEIDPGKIPDNTISVGVHFDNESLAALLLNTNINLNKKGTHQASLTVRLGQQIFGRLDYTVHPFNPKWFFTLSYQIGDNDMDLYNNGHKACTYSYIHHLAQINISRSWNNIRCSLGGRYEYYNYNNVLVPSGINKNKFTLQNQHLITYYGQMHFDSYNRRTYPTKGTKWNILCELQTDNGVRYEDDKTIPILSALWEGAFRITNRFTFLPWIGGRAILSKEYSFASANMIGGNTESRYVPQQFPFVGVNHMQLVGSKLLEAGLRFRQRMGSNHYVTATANAGVQNNEWEGLLKKTLWGGGVSYGYDTFLGPIEVTFNYSSITKKFGTYISLGYEF